ncbi:60Kd inner membrane protein-domain-containing protein [Delphinella strobiligena]|nr:60Kd inner membrane protein-domain-containing protein [Delphinella strobiligena]
MMMPSRGIVSAAGAARQAARLNRRFISTTPSRNIQTSLQRPFPLGLLQTLPHGDRERIVSASAILLAAQSRLASTSNTIAPNDGIAASTPGPVDNAAAEVSSSFDISSITDSYLASMPEQIGYLKEIGLDYGWGPTAMIEWGLEHVHVYSGLPWWGSIVATALCFRLALFPLFLRSSDVGARQAAMLPITKPLTTRMMEAFKAQDMETGISMTVLMGPALLQAVFGFCAFKLMRAMANLPVPGLENGGILWFVDLTQRDPYLALPAIMAISMHAIFRMGGESGAPMQNPAMRPFMLYVMPGLVFISTVWLPANLNLWLATTGLVGMAQVSLFRQADVRSALGMAPLVPNDPRTPGAHPGPANTIDVKGFSRPSSSQSLRYQAPNIKTGSPSGASQTKERMTSGINDMSEGLKTAYTEFQAKAASYGGRNQKVSKTRSKEFLKQAAEYERRWQKAQRGSAKR